MAMGNEQTMKLDKIINIFEGVKVVEENSKIDSVVAYRLGRLSDQCRSIIRVYERLQHKLKAETGEKITALRSDWEARTDEEKQVINLEVKALNEEFMRKIDDLMETDEKIRIPELKLKDFEEKGVPVKFFTLLGDIIQE